MVLTDHCLGRTVISDRQWSQGTDHLQWTIISDALLPRALHRLGQLVNVVHVLGLGPFLSHQTTREIGSRSSSQPFSTGLGKVKGYIMFSLDS